MGCAIDRKYFLFFLLYYTLPQIKHCTYTWRIKNITHYGPFCSIEHCQSYSEWTQKMLWCSPTWFPCSSYLAVGLIPELDFENFCGFRVSCDGSHELNQGGFTTSNRTALWEATASASLLRLRHVESTSTRSLGLIYREWTMSIQKTLLADGIVCVKCLAAQALNKMLGRGVPSSITVVTATVLTILTISHLLKFTWCAQTCSVCLGDILGSTTPHTATTFCDRSSDTTWPRVNLLAFWWRHITEPWLANTRAFSTSNCWVSSKDLDTDGKHAWPP